MKKEENTVTELIDDKLKVIVELKKTPDKEKVVIQSTVENEWDLSNEETPTQNQNDQTCSSASTSSYNNTQHQKSAQNLKKSKHDQKSSVITTLDENQREQQVQLADSIHRLSTLNINSQQNNLVSTTEEIGADVIQSEVNDVNQNQPNVLYMIKPLPKLEDKMLSFLSEDLIQKTCEVFIYSYFNFRN